MSHNSTLFIIVQNGSIWYAALNFLVNRPHIILTRSGIDIFLFNSGRFRHISFRTNSPSKCKLCATIQSHFIYASKNFAKSGTIGLPFSSVISRVMPCTFIDSSLIIAVAGSLTYSFTVSSIWLVVTLYRIQLNCIMYGYASIGG